MKAPFPTQEDQRELARKWLYQIERKAAELRRALQTPPPCLGEVPCLLSLLEADLSLAQSVARGAEVELRAFAEVSEGLAKELAKQRERSSQARADLDARRRELAAGR